MKQNNIDDDNISIKLIPQNIENLFNIYQNGDNMYFYNILKTVKFPEVLNPQIYNLYNTVPKDTWPLIAWKFYKNIDLWWIICAVNGIENPVGQPRPGTPLKILNAGVVRDILTTIRQN